MKNVIIKGITAASITAFMCGAAGLDCDQWEIALAVMMLSGGMLGLLYLANAEVLNRKMEREEEWARRKERLEKNARKVVGKTDL